MQLSKRMESVASMVSVKGRLADVGCDHGYLPIWLYQEGRISGAIAMDINPGPLKRARANIAQYGLERYIQTRLSDGMKELAPGEADMAIVAGMGGKLIVRILQDSPLIVNSLQELILEPQSETAAVRKYLEERNLRIVQEDMVLEDGKFYPVIKAIPDTLSGNMQNRGILPAGPMTAEQLKYGPCLLKNRHPVLYEYLQKTENSSLLLAENLRKSQSPRAEERLKEIQEEIQHIRAAYGYYEV